MKRVPMMPSMTIPELENLRILQRRARANLLNILTLRSANGRPRSAVHDEFAAQELTAEESSDHDRETDELPAQA